MFDGTADGARAATEDNAIKATVSHEGVFDVDIARRGDMDTVEGEGVDNAVFDVQRRAGLKFNAGVSAAAVERQPAQDDGVIRTRGNCDGVARGGPYAAKDARRNDDAHRFVDQKRAGSEACR